MSRILWTEENIKVGFYRFLQENGRLPRAHEIDTLPYLPSSRFIQKKLGGLEELRTRLGFSDTHFGKGTHRSTIAHQVNSRGRDYERKLEKQLHNHFGEVFVHSEKMLVDSKVRVDFYIYSPDGNFAIDIFYASTVRTLQSNVNIKTNKYKLHNIKIYLVSANNSIDQDKLDTYATARISSLPSNILLLTYDLFIKIIKTKRVYTNPVE